MKERKKKKEREKERSCTSWLTTTTVGGVGGARCRNRTVIPKVATPTIIVSSNDRSNWSGSVTIDDTATEAAAIPSGLNSLYMGVVGAMYASARVREYARERGSEGGSEGGSEYARERGSEGAREGAGVM